MPLLVALLCGPLGLHLPSAAPSLGHGRAPPPRAALKLEVDPEAAAAMLEDGPAAAQGPFGKGGALEWVADGLDALAEVVLAQLHRFDDEAVQDSSKNLQVLWSRAVLAKNGELADDIALELLPKSTRGVVTAGLFDGVSNFLEWVSARTVFLNEGCDAFLSSPACAGGKDCQVVIFGAGFDTRSIRYQREGLRFFEVDLPDTIEAKRVVHERYRDEVKPDVRLPTRIGWDLNDCEHSSLLDHLADEHGFRRDVPTMFISEAVMFYVNPKAIASLYDEIFEFGQSAHRPPAPAGRPRAAAPGPTSHLPPPPLTSRRRPRARRHRGDVLLHRLDAPLRLGSLRRRVDPILRQAGGDAARPPGAVEWGCPVRPRRRADGRRGGVAADRPRKGPRRGAGDLVRPRA